MSYRICIQLGLLVDSSSPILWRSHWSHQDYILPNSQFLEGSISYQLHHALPADKSTADLISNTKKLQQRLTLESTDNIVSSILANPQPQRSPARFRSLQGVGAGALLDSVPLSTKFALKPGEFRLATCLRLGCEMPLASVISTFDCGKHYRAYGAIFVYSN